MKTQNTIKKYKVTAMIANNPDMKKVYNKQK